MRSSRHNVGSNLRMVNYCTCAVEQIGPIAITCFSSPRSATGKPKELCIMNCAQLIPENVPVIIDILCGQEQ